jgi:hypothetical protein
MMQAFPELSRRNGVVFSYENLDNVNPKYPKQYPHAWLVTEKGYIVDPTRSQFDLLGELQYKELDPCNEIRKCMGCGVYYDAGVARNSAFCGKCEWSE